MEEETICAFIMGVFVSFIITLFAVLILNDSAWKRDAVAHGHAKYEVVPNGIIFKWNDEVGDPCGH